MPLLSALLSTSTIFMLDRWVIRRVGQGVALLLLGTSTGGVDSLMRPLGHLSGVVIQVDHDSMMHSWPSTVATPRALNPQSSKQVIGKHLIPLSHLSS